MKYRHLIGVVLLVCIIVTPCGFAQEPRFPTTAEEIIDGLTMKDARVQHEGVIYESKKGKVYKVINGRRFRIRGLKVVANTPLVPKVSALILFDFDSAIILPESHRLLSEFGKALNSGLTDARLSIAGHTDAKGAAQYNQQLSEARAQAVIDFLIQKHNVPANRLAAVGYGEDQPIADNSTDIGRRKNRRVEFVRIK